MLLAQKAYVLAKVSSTELAPFETPCETVSKDVVFTTVFIPEIVPLSLIRIKPSSTFTPVMLPGGPCGPRSPCGPTAPPKVGDILG